ncbi:MAG: hypothetical protein ACK559_21475, partial [bacterium]
MAAAHVAAPAGEDRHHVEAERQRRVGRCRHHPQRQFADVAGMDDADRGVAVGQRSQHDATVGPVDRGELSVAGRDLRRGGHVERPPVGGP